MGIEEGTCWDEHWVLRGNQLENKLHFMKKHIQGLLLLNMRIAFHFQPFLNVR